MALIENIMPENYLVPGGKMKFDLTNAIRGIRGMPRSIILAGFANISSPELLAGAGIRVVGERHVIAVAGQDSVLHQMYRALPKEVKTSMPVHVFKLDDTIGTKTQCEMEITMVSPLGIDIACQVLINGLILPLVLTAGSDQNDVAAAIGDVITDNAVRANVTCVVVDNVVTVTSAFGGYEGNGMLFCILGTEKADVPIEGLPTFAVVGEGDQDIAPLLAYLAQNRITEIAWPGHLSAANYALFNNALLDLWGPTTGRDTQLMEVISVQDAASGVATLATRNCHQIHSLILPAYLRSPAWAISAAAAGGIEYKAGIKPTRPLRDIPLLNVLPPVGDWTEDEMNTLLAEGGSTTFTQGGVLYIQRMVTNYTKNIADIEDASFRNLEWIKTMSWWRWFVLSEFALKYRDYMMAEVWDESFADQDVMTDELAQVIIIGLYRIAIDNLIMQDMEGYVADLQTQIAGASGRLKYLEKPRLITQHYQTEITSEPIVGSLS